MSGAGAALGTLVVVGVCAIADTGTSAAAAKTKADKKPRMNFMICPT
jgi:hypothetical protein